MLPRFKVNNAQFKQHTHSINKTHLSGSKMKTNNKQRGFTLVTVLILSSLASILVLNSLKDNVNQERLSGNFQKKINSRLASERGVFDSMAAARTFLSNNQSATLEDIVAHLNAGQLTDTISLTNGGIKYTVTPTAVAGELVLSSIGNRFEGESALKVRLKVTPGGGGSPFADAVVGCEGVNLSGSGRVDSYNSNNEISEVLNLLANFIK